MGNRKKYFVRVAIVAYNMWKRTGVFLAKCRFSSGMIDLCVSLMYNFIRENGDGLRSRAFRNIGV